MLYRQYLESIPVTSHKTAGQLLRVIVCSGRPLRIGEINLLINHSVKPGAEREHPIYTDGAIARLLYPFIRVSGGHLLIHQSIIEFLLDLDTKENDDLAKAFGVNIHRDRLFIAGACMRYLLSDTFFSDLFAHLEDDLEDEYDQDVESSVEGLSSFINDWVGEVNEELGFDNFQIRLLSAGGMASDEERYKNEDEFQNMVIRLFNYFSIQTIHWLRYYWALTNGANDARPEALSPLVLAGYFGHFTIHTSASSCPVTFVYYLDTLN
ncbi:hypothetical protein TWF506_009428 [Arthrobotrys conoides]|uniref:Uncharacterized protein n=1 Tax=Arthrobotrys conoides TaxID=74498 RepID=A0AAN8RMB2_9PEZI